MDHRSGRKTIHHPLEALRRWENGHHLFFVLIQGLIVVHQRLEQALRNEDWPAANDALTDATQLWWACAAAFHFTGDFTQDAYETSVRPSMEPPRERDGFSGLHSADHSYLLQLLRTLKPLLETLPPELKRRHGTYLWSLDALYESHAMVCERHVGSKPSLKMEAARTEAPAPDMIRNLKARTLKLAACPAQP
jgi:hypothetical protein